MKNLSKKLLMSVVAVTLVVIALGTSTFAWFTLSNKASVGQFEAQVTAGDGIEISLAGQTNNWYTDIPTNIMQEYIVSTSPGAGAGFEEFKDLTSKNGVNIIDFDNDPASKKNYVEFQVNFRSKQAGMKIYWSEIILSGALLDGSVVKPWLADQPFVGADGVSTPVDQSMTIDPSNAIRVSVAEKTDLATTNVYEKPENTGTTSSFLGGNTVLGDAFKSNGAVAYYNAKNTIDITSADFDTVPLAKTVIDATTNKLQIVELVLNGTSGYYEGSATVRVWVEGWDPDAYNAVLTGKVTVALRFIGLV